MLRGSDTSEYVIEVVFNHNAVMCTKKNTAQKMLFFGKGIGYKKKSGDYFFCFENVEKNMILVDETQEKLYKNLLYNPRSEKIIEVVNEIVEQAHSYFKGEINAQLHLTLLDHLNFALERKNHGIEINYPFLNELDVIYKKEFEFAEWAYKLITQKISSDFSESEVGFLTLHFHAALTNRKVSVVMIQQKILKDIVTFVEEKFHIKIDVHSIYYQRLIVHIGYVLKRSIRNIKIENKLLEVIKQSLKDDYSVAKEICDILQKSYQLNLSEDEVGYLALHINSLRINIR